MRHRAAPGLVRSSLADVIDLVLRRECAGCGRTGTSWCSDCWSSLLGVPQVRRLDGPEARASLSVWSAGEYRDEVRSAVVAWKDRGRTDLTPVLARALRRSVLQAWGAAERPRSAAAGSGPVLLVPAPSSARSRRQRGHEPVRDLALRCAAALRRQGVEVRVVPVLAQARQLQDQVGLGVAGRSANLAGALCARQGWTRHVLGRDCIVVDDVVTTGATLLECRRALTDVGARVHGAATVAATPRRAPHGGDQRFTRTALQTGDG
ncbi:MAG TPA: phosphoribosyltransferase family protein [Actinomycetales bacterium]|nr:phosphoribosyltransferase family protein [Actinomycetales bacterium]